MKDATAFARKRKTRDKANLRWIKNRHLVMPSLVGLMLVGGLMGGTVANTFDVYLIPAGTAVGAMLAFGIGGRFVIKGLCE